MRPRLLGPPFCLTSTTSISVASYLAPSWPNLFLLQRLLERSVLWQPAPPYFSNLSSSIPRHSRGEVALYELTKSDGRCTFIVVSGRDVCVAMMRLADDPAMHPKCNLEPTRDASPPKKAIFFFVW
jgi:hypothetical protein